MIMMTNSLLRIVLLSAALAVPGMVCAQPVTAPKTLKNGNCPVVDTSAMQKNMGMMMENVSAVMGSTSDPSLKARMQNMHDQMASMMGNMQQMNGNGAMMGSAMMGGAAMHGRKDPSNKSPATTEGRDSHHPKQ
jgi:hypothetical protein